MGVCDMCGSQNRLFKVRIEGTILNVCNHCSRFGKIVSDVHDKKWTEKMQYKFAKQRVLKKEEPVETLVEDFAKIIRDKREQLNMKQEELALKINEKESIIHKIETGHFEPNIKLAKTLEHFLKIKILEIVSTDQPVGSEKVKSDSFTLGDFIKIRKNN